MSLLKDVDERVRAKTCQVIAQSELSMLLITPDAEILDELTNRCKDKKVPRNQLICSLQFVVLPWMDCAKYTTKHIPKCNHRVIICRLNGEDAFSGIPNSILSLCYIPDVDLK